MFHVGGLQKVTKNLKYRYTDNRTMSKKTSISIDPKLWREAKKRAIDEDMTIGQFVEKLLERELKGKK